MMQQFEQKFYGTEGSRDLHSFPVTTNASSDWHGMQMQVEKEKKIPLLLKCSSPSVYSYSPASANVNNQYQIGFAKDQPLLLKATKSLRAPMWNKAVMDFSRTKRLL